MEESNSIEDVSRMKKTRKVKSIQTKSSMATRSQAGKSSIPLNESGVAQTLEADDFGEESVGTPLDLDHRLHSSKELSSQDFDSETGVTNFTSVDVAEFVIAEVMMKVGKALEFTCPKCLRAFRDGYQLERHFKCVHSEPRRCNRCSEVFADKGECNFINYLVF